MPKSKAVYTRTLVVLIIAGAIAFVLSFFMGSSGVSFADFLQLVQGKADAAQANIFLNIRLPRALTAFIVGSALAVAGCSLQGVFKNPMAEPYTTGISAGAALGATISIALGFGITAIGVSYTTLFSFGFALIAILIVYSISNIRGKVSTFSLLLSGFAVSSLLSSFTYFIMMIYHDKLANIILWNFGSVSTASWEKFGITLPIILVCCILLVFYAKPMNILLHGDEISQSLGVDSQKVRRNLVVITALLVAAAVSVSGIIGFVGLMVPHLLRLIVGPDNKKLLPLCFVGGGAFLLCADTIAKLIIPSTEMPVGIITAMFGVPFFIYLLRRGRKAGI
jgi:iron complex transport system permease protein